MADWRELRELLKGAPDILSSLNTETGLTALNTQFTKVANRLPDMNLSPAGLAIGTIANTDVKVTNTVTFLLDGVFKEKTTAEVAFTATTHDITADSGSVQEACYAIGCQAGGTLTITMGSVVSGAGNAAIPNPPANENMFGYVRIAVDAGSTDFNATTDALNAAHLTVTYVDTAYHPDMDTLATVNVA